MIQNVQSRRNDQDPEPGPYPIRTERPVSKTSRHEVAQTPFYGLDYVDLFTPFGVGRRNLRLRIVFFVNGGNANPYTVTSGLLFS